MKKKRVALGWAKEKVGRQLIEREFISKKEMKKAFEDFMAASHERTKGMTIPCPFSRKKSENNS